MRRVHIRTGGVGEIGCEVFELTRDGEFVVAEEKVDVGHGFSHRAHREKRDSFLFFSKNSMISVANSFSDDSVDAFAHRDNIHDLHVPQIRFGGDVGLKPWAERFAEQVAKDGEH